eukprot:15060767-Alexandrium_andersonii.AAC.1
MTAADSGEVTTTAKDQSDSDSESGMQQDDDDPDQFVCLDCGQSPGSVDADSPENEKQLVKWGRINKGILEGDQCHACMRTFVGCLKGQAMTAK